MLAAGDCGCPDGSQIHKKKGLEHEISKKLIQISERGDGDYVHPERRKFPKAPIALAFFLTVAGAYLTIYGLLVLGGICLPKHSDGMGFIAVLGVITFIAGVYHMVIALCAYFNVPGYSFDDIPQF